MTSTQHNTDISSIISSMTLEEKLAQLVGFWQDEGGDVVAPLQGEVAHTGALDQAVGLGLGHFTRVYGTSPVDADARAAWLWEQQRKLVTDTRHGIPAIVHEECLTGLSAWKAATYPAPLSWGASFNPDLIAQMGAQIGESMRSLGIHQGLAPVLDVVRDARWGRVEECISEDPYLVGAIGTAYVQGIQSEGVHATLKHFVGYSASQSGRNFAPVHAGPRELADVLLIPFEMAVLDGKVRSVMHSYAEIDGVPVAADESLLTDLLRGTWGFDGVVVADYFGVAFLQILHHVAGDLGEAAGLALKAGVDVELPTGNAYLVPLAEAVRSGAVDEALVDRAVLRVLAQKEELGLLGATFEDEPPAGIDLDSPAHRDVARTLAEQSIVLVSNDGALPFTPNITGRSKIAVVGPNADRPNALFGCYSFANHVLAQHPGTPMGFEAPSVREAIAAEWDADVTFALGCDVASDDASGIEEAERVTRDADVAFVVVGDSAGLFGRATSGEGCDTDSLELPGVQRELVERLLATGTPVVLVAVTGRPYALGWAMERCAAVVQAFFPGEEGAGAIAGVLSGRVNPSGKLPVSLPRSAGAQPYSYLHPTLGGDGEVSNLSTIPASAFGTGLSYTTFAHTDLEVDAEVTCNGAITATVTVTNTGARAGADVVQLYGHDLVGSVTRPVAQLIGFARIELEAGESRRVEFRVPTTRLAFTNRAGVRVVESGDVDLWVGASDWREATARIELTGPDYKVTVDSNRMTTATVS
ncbi:glycoside hydrolase family 3 N-terminal domain-containing protein [Demequina oxidasica]|uniref:beta-xylosidase/alpha-l-arabinosidase n=1 Tax=Demequina oxidasica TaxID=676199 RepID=UPI000785CCC7|nr:glycoside hydrolase family 3 N-terminal domain-containing protein [Demequina oxidasica]